MTDEKITAVVDTQTGDFVTEGHAPDDRFHVVALPRSPDVLREKWDGSAIVAKTAPEIAAARAALRRADALAALSANPAAKAVLVRALTVRLGHAPSVAELETELDAYTQAFLGGA